MDVGPGVPLRYPPPLCAVFLLSDLACHVRFQLKRAPPCAFNDVHIDVHALTHGVVVLAPANFKKHRGVVHILGAEVVRIVPIFLEFEPPSMAREVRRRGRMFRWPKKYRTDDVSLAVQSEKSVVILLLKYSVFLCLGSFLRNWARYSIIDGCTP